MKGDRNKTKIAMNVPCYRSDFGTISTIYSDIKKAKSEREKKPMKFKQTENNDSNYVKNCEESELFTMVDCHSFTDGG